MVCQGLSWAAGVHMGTKQLLQVGFVVLLLFGFFCCFFFFQDAY